MRAGRMRKKLQKDPGKLHDYLRVRPIPIVVRAKKFYLVDHHHLMRALYDAEHETRGKDICVYVNVMGTSGTLYICSTAPAAARSFPKFRDAICAN